jgi:hypothetical protein
MKHTILDDSGATLGTIDITPERAAEIAAAKADEPSDDGTWHFTAGDWLTDEEISALGTSHELEVQIIPAEEGGAA